jgi:hypothetical protein
MPVFLPLYERIHLSYNENEITDLMYDQLDDLVQKHNDEMVELYAAFYIGSMFCLTFFYVMYIIIS